MKKILLFITILTLSFSTFARFGTWEPINRDNSYYGSNGCGEISSTTGRIRNERVNGYHRKDGTYVNPYYRSK
jgi:hypothetical protein